MLRRWINDLDDYMPKYERDRLKAEAEAKGFEMVRKYEDWAGITRVSGAQRVKPQVQKCDQKQTNLLVTIQYMRTCCWKHTARVVGD